MNDPTKVVFQSDCANALNEQNRHYINLSCVGNLIRPNEEKQPERIELKDNTRVILKTKLLRCGKASIYPDKEMQGDNTKNLKKGGREAISRTNLTSYAKRMIQNSGDMMKWAIENDARFLSPLMVTLTYGRSVPDHPTAKKHLNLFLNRCRKNNWLSTYVWVAQLQTGKRAKQKGIYSYRAEHGSAIHFHIITMTERGSDLQLNNAQKVLRSFWKKIVNDWERKSGYKEQNIGGVDVTAVYDSSRYVSTYIKNEQETIMGNMWGMSSGMRDLIKTEDFYTGIPKIVFNEICNKVDAKKMFRTNAEGKTERIRIASGNTIAVRNWDNSYILLTNDYEIINSEFNRYAKNFGFQIHNWTEEDKSKEKWIQETANIAKQSIYRKFPDKNSARQNVNSQTTDLKSKPVTKPVPKPVPKPVQMIIQV